MSDTVNHPAHYTQHPSGVECIQITEHMGFNLGNMKKLIFALLVCTYGIVHAEDGSAFEHHTPIAYHTTNIGDSDFEYAILPSYILTFSNKQGMVGTLDFNGPTMTFQGNADKSARVFFDYLDAQLASRLAAERKKARDDVEFCVREHLKSGESPLLCFDK